MRHKLKALACFSAAIVASCFVSWYLRLTVTGPTPQEYLSAKPSATLVPAKQFTSEGHNFSCANYPVVLNPSFAEYGAAFFGFILLNPDRFASLSRPLQRFAFAHECGHQYVGYSETAADCYAVRRGVSDGWLDTPSLEEICAFFSRSKGTAFHLPGPQRCAAITSCYIKNYRN